MTRRKFRWQTESPVPAEMFDLERIGKMDDYDEFLMPRQDKKVKCVFCEWEGQRKDAKCREVSTPARSWRMLAGREGWEWHCPRCNMIVDSHYTKMS